MSIKYRIAETEVFQKEISQPRFRKIYGKIKDFVYPQLRTNPFFGPKIKKLKGQFSDFYRFRIGKYRLFYKIDEEKILVFIPTIQDCKDAYKNKK